MRCRAKNWKKVFSVSWSKIISNKFLKDLSSEHLRTFFKISSWVINDLSVLSSQFLMQKFFNIFLILVVCHKNWSSSLSQTKLHFWTNDFKLKLWCPTHLLQYWLKIHHKKSKSKYFLFFYYEISRFPCFET